MADLSSFAPQSPTATMAMANVAAAPVASPASVAPASAADYSKYDVPKVFRSNRDSSVEPRLGANSSPEAQAMMDKGADYYDIPAFLRKQAD
jgi:cell division protein FtsZ